MTRPTPRRAFLVGALLGALGIPACSLEPPRPSVRVRLVAENGPPGTLAVSLAPGSIDGRTALETPDEFWVEPGTTLTLELLDLPSFKEIEAWTLDGSFLTADSATTVTIDKEATVTLVLNVGRIHRVRPDGSGQFASLQEAIAAAASDDIIELAPGTYTGGLNRDLDPQGKNLRFRGQGAAVTTLDLTGVETQGFVFRSGEGGPLSVVEGITIRGASSLGSPGVGAWCAGASPTFRGCVFVDNATAIGGAVYIRGGSPVFEDCAFDSCLVYLGGGAVHLEAGTAEFRDSRFLGNRAWGDDSVHGGALFVEDGASATLTNCVFEGNRATGSGGGVASFGFVEAVGCVFRSNSGEDPINSRGGGFFGDGSLDRCEFRLNRAAAGGAIYLGGTGGVPANVPVIARCTLVENTADCDGGGLVTDGLGNTIDHTIVAFNSVVAPGTGAGGASDYSLATVTCCDFFGNVPSNTSGINLGVGANFSLDPQFCDLATGNLLLSASSPCLPANNPACTSTVGSAGAGCP